MHQILALMAQYGAVTIFVAIIAERAGLPLPTYPILIVAAGAIAHADQSLLQLLVISFTASMIPDLVWYRAGQRYGARLLKLLCRISISPDSCVRQTETIYSRWGVWSLLVAKFVPGFSIMAAPLAGVFKQRPSVFLMYDALGSLIWCGSAIVLGYAFQDAVDDLLQELVHFGGIGLLLILGAFALYIAVKWLRRHYLIRSLRADRITTEELNDLMRSGAAPVIIDARSRDARELDGMIPGAIGFDESAIDSLATFLLSCNEVVVYCNCPNEVSAAKIAQQLMRLGVKRVRPLLGGMDAWLAMHDPKVIVATSPPSP